jgi:hypothetical protein
MIRLPRRIVRYASLLALTAAALLVPAAPASADDPVADLTCTITVTTDVNPGLTSAGGTQAVTSHGLTGTADCTGTVNGEPVTGTGTFAVDTVVHATSCTESTGEGTFVLKIPTASGTQTVVGRFSSVTTGGNTISTGDLTGTFDVVATDGDCVNTPITHTTTVINAHIT